MSLRHILAGLLFLMGMSIARDGMAVERAPSADQPGRKAEWLQPLLQKTWTGDLDAMIQRRVIRALVPYSKTYYFVDKGTQRGSSYDFLKLFEDELNKTLKKEKKRSILMVFVAVPRDQLIPALTEGRGDIAAGGLTVTPGRDQLVAFSNPTFAPVDEIIVTGPATPKIATLDDLSGQEIFVRKSSSYHEHLLDLNAKFEKAGKAPVRLKLAPESLEDEDLLEMLNAGLVPLLVVDHPTAEFWSKILPNISARSDLVVNSGGEIAWMFRQDSPKLQSAVNDFLKRHPASDPTRAEILREYWKSTKFVKDAASQKERSKFNATVELFKKYSGQYDVNYLMMMAEGYEESRLDQRARSRVGAVGVMQVMPATGRELKVGDIYQIDANIHAGVKFITLLRNEYFGNEPMDEMNKDLFAFAAYDAGPGRINGLRKLAAKRGLNPNIWRSNVEVVVSEEIGRETVDYVGNIFKYYIAYSLITEAEQARQKAKSPAQ